MKNKLFIVALMVVVFTLALAGSAFATQGNSTYTNWTTEASAAVGAGPSPHAQYALTTKNCGVCHAVHHSTGTQVLLATDIGNACNYCHINGGTGYTTVYGGDTANKTNITGFAEIRNHSNLCTECHAVHGANTAWLGQFILVKKTYGAAGQVDPSTSATSDELGIAKWCTGCHSYFMTAHNSSSHVMTSATNSFDAPGNTLPAGTKVAWTDSNTCQKCHNATLASGFPHYTANAPRFLVNGIVNNVASPTQVNNDGVCLACHQTVGSGVNKTF